MKQAFVIACIASLALAGVLWWTGSAATDAREGTPRVRAGGKAILDPRTASGRDIFVPDLGTTSLDGVECVWPAWLFYCAALEPVDGERLRIEHLRVLQNARPLQRADLAHHVQLSDDLSPAAAGQRLEELVSGTRAGLLADSAELLGGHTMLSVRRVDLKGRALLARMSAGVRETVRAADLALDFDHGRLTHARTAAEVDIESALFALKSRGLALDAVTGAVDLLRDVSGRSLRPVLEPAGTEPFRFESAGLVRFTPDKAPAADRVLPAGGILRAAGGVEAHEGSAAMRSAALELTFGGEPARIQRLQLEGGVDAQLPVFSASGERVLVDIVTGTVEAAGAPLALRWNDPDSLLRMVESDGLVTVSAPDANGLLQLDARESSRLSGPATSINGRAIHALLERGAGGRMRPREVSARAVTGHFGPADFAAGELSLCTKDGFRELLLTGAPRLVFRLSDGSGRAAALLGVAEDVPLVLVVESAGPLQFLADPLRHLPGTVSAKDAVRLTLHQGDERGAVLARVQAGSLTLGFLDMHTRETLGGVRYQSRVELVRAEAAGSVVLERGPFTARAQALEINLKGSAVQLRGSPARIEHLAEDGFLQWCTADGLLLSVLSRTLSVGGSWQGVVRMPAFTREPGQAMQATEARGTGGQLAFGSDGRTLESLEGVAAVQLHQANGGGARAEALEYTLEPRRFAARGAVRLELARPAGAPEVVTAPEVQWFGEALFAAGPLQASLAAPPLRLSGRPTASTQALLEIACAGSLSSHGGILVLEGPLSARQNLDAARAVELSGQRALFFFDDSPTGRTLERLVLEGDVICHTEDMDVRGALLRADIPDRRMLLSGGSDPCVLSLAAAGLRDHRRPAFLVDFTDPDNPVVESVDRPIPPESR